MYSLKLTVLGSKKDKKYLSELVGTEYESDLPRNLAESIKSQHKSNNRLLK
jgi:hypothetical protein